MKTSLLLGLSALTFACVAMAEAPEYEMVCRSKAKEIAADTYRGCVVEARTTQIEQLKKDYQERLHQMKDDYERQLKNLSSGKASSKTDKNKSEATVTVLPAKRASKGKKVATMLPKVAPVKRAAKNADDVEEMTVEVKPVSNANSDDSTLDIPEPTPIESVPTADAASL